MLQGKHDTDEQTGNTTTHEIRKYQIKQSNEPWELQEQIRQEHTNTWISAKWANIEPNRLYNDKPKI